MGVNKLNWDRLRLAVERDDRGVFDVTIPHGLTHIEKIEPVLDASPDCRSSDYLFHGPVSPGVAGRSVDCLIANLVAQPVDDFIDFGLRTLADLQFK